jgi:hypothetical protein
MLPDFIPRKRADGMWEAICTSCYRTIGKDAPTADIEQLGFMRSDHACAPGGSLRRARSDEAAGEPE